MTHLLGLHTDLLDKIFGYLPTTDIMNVSMTCLQLFKDTKRYRQLVKSDFEDILQNTEQEYFMNCKWYKLEFEVETFVDARTAIKAYVMKH